MGSEGHFRALLCAFLGLLVCADIRIARAHDHGRNEGAFTNTGSTPLRCFKDIWTPRHTLCVATLPPGATCHADAVGAVGGKRVYKTPNRTDFVCKAHGGDLVCNPKGLLSLAILKLAKFKNGPVYEYLDSDRFASIMAGGKDKQDHLEIDECDLDWKIRDTVQDVNCDSAESPYGGTFDMCFRLVTNVAEALQHL